MKRISLIIILGLSVLWGCDRKLPYDLDGVRRGVGISVTKTPFTDLRLIPESADGNYSLNLTIPRQQGDYSFMSEARVMCLYTPASGERQYVETGVSVPRSSFEPEIAVPVVINLPALCSQLGIAAPALEDNISFTTDVVLNNGDVLPGWTALTNYTTMSFTSWVMLDGSNFNYRASYDALPEFIPGDFINNDVLVSIDGRSTTGTMEASGTLPDPDIIPYGFVPDDFYGYVFNMAEETTYLEAAVNNMVIWVNQQDFSLLIPFQSVDTVDWDDGYEGDLFFYGTTGSVNTSTITMTFRPNLYLLVGSTYYNFGSVVFVLTFPRP